MSSALVAALVATVVSLLLRDEPAIASAPADPEALIRLQDLERRVATLESVPPPAVAPSSAAPVDAAAPAAASPHTREVVRTGDPDLTARLARLETAVERITQSALQQSYADPTRITAEQLAAEQQTIVDPDSTVAEKLAAHQRLRKVADAHTPATVHALVQLATTNKDATVRADVWRCFDGGSHLPGLVPHLLWALTNDSDSAPREEAAETLGKYGDDPAVVPALEAARSHDASERVRSKAGRTLAGMGRGQ